MTRIRRSVLALLMVLTVAGPVAPAFAGQPSPSQEPMGEFVPLENLPPQEQMPAAPLVIAAYSFVWVALFVYIVSIARRLGGVQRDVERLQTDFKKR